LWSFTSYSVRPEQNPGSPESSYEHGFSLKSLKKNPGTAAFDRGQKFAPIVIALVALAALLMQGASVIAVPIVFAVVGLYALIVIGGAQVIRALGLKFLDDAINE